MDNTTTFLFPGQGSQFTGMGHGFIESSDTAKNMLKEANDTLGFDIGALINNGPDEELALTANTQPAILLVSAIVLEALREKGAADPGFVAGHSLGEFSACYAAGVFSLADALRIVRKRGELMQSAVPAGEGGMAAIIGLSSDQVTTLCDKADGEVFPANFNSPEQTVIAGSKAGVEAAMALAGDLGAKKVVPLAVSAPFHTSFMKPAQEGLADFMASIPFADPAIPLIRNVDATVAHSGEEVRQGLIDQVTSCVRWVDSMKTMVSAGVTRALEIGPGKVLMGLQRRIDRAVKVTPVGEPEDIIKALEITNG